MTVFFTSDTHFGHAAILEHAPHRKLWYGETIEQHDEAMIETWNSVVGPRDIVWHLGDFAVTKKHAAAIRPRLNGSIHLIRGNHDVEQKLDKLDCWASVHDAHYLRLDCCRIYLHHYACRVWRKSHHGSFHLFGHSHGDMRGLGRSMDVGVDLCRWPMEWCAIRRIMSARDPVPHHGPDAGVPRSLDP